MSQPLDRFLAGHDPLARLQAHAGRLARLQEILLQALPSYLADSCGVGNLRDQELVILSRNGATSARLKQMVPSLLQAYLREGILLTGIRVRIENPTPMPTPSPPPQRTVSRGVRADMLGLAEALPGDSPLSQALRRFVSRTGGDGRSGESA